MNEQGSYVVDLPADWSGVMELCAYRFKSTGIAVRKTRTFYVRPASQLEIQTRLDRDVYRPGEQAELEFRVTDRSGRPVPAALGLTAVDEAVYSVRSSQPPLYRTLAELDRKLLQPVFAIYPKALVEPADTENRAWRRLEQAAFATTYRQRRDPETIIRQLMSYLDDSDELLDLLQRPDWYRFWASTHPRWMTGAASRVWVGEIRYPKHRIRNKFESLKHQ